MRPSIMWNHLTPRVVLVSSRFPMFFSQFLQVSLCQGQVPHGLHSASLLRPRAPSCAGQRQRAGPGAEKRAGSWWSNVAKSQKHKETLGNMVTRSILNMVKRSILNHITLFLYHDLISLKVNRTWGNKRQLTGHMTKLTVPKWFLGMVIGTVTKSQK